MTYLFLVCFCIASFVSAAGDDASSHKPSLFDRYQQMSEEELKAALAEEDFDMDQLTSAVQEDCTPLSKDEPLTLATKGYAAAGVAHVATLDDLVDQQKLDINTAGFIEWQTAVYTSPSISSIPELQSPVISGLGKIHKFLDEKVSGKRIEVVAMVVYIIYRQLSYVYQQHIKEICERSPFKKKEFTYTETMLGLVGFNSCALAYTDVLIRVSFCSMRMWLDLHACIKAFKRYEWLQDPEGYIREIKFYLQRARLLFTDPLYYGSNMSLIKRVMLGLAVPFAWVSLFSQNSPGAPFQNPFFIEALTHTTTALAHEGGLHAQALFEKKAKPSLQKKLFKYSGGIIRERLFVDAALWAGECVGRKYIRGEEIKPASFLGKKVGQYAIRHVYLQGLIYVISQAIRGGALQACGWLGDKIGWVLSKLGFFKENPVTAARQLIQKKAVRMGLLEEGQKLIDILVYPACVFPGAFARAVRGVITKQAAAPVLAKDPGFVACLNAMHGMSVIDLLHAMATNFMIPQQMSGYITRVKNAVSVQQWRKILNRFLNELILEIFFDRQRMLCQFVTEPILTALSSPILTYLYGKVLPS